MVTSRPGTALDRPWSQLSWTSGSCSLDPESWASRPLSPSALLPFPPSSRASSRLDSCLEDGDDQFSFDISAWKRECRDDLQEYVARPSVRRPKSKGSKLIRSAVQRKVLLPAQTSRYATSSSVFASLAFSEAATCSLMGFGTPLKCLVDGDREMSDEDRAFLSQVFVSGQDPHFGLGRGSVGESLAIRERLRAFSASERRRRHKEASDHQRHLAGAWQRKRIRQQMECKRRKAELGAVESLAYNSNTDSIDVSGSSKQSVLRCKSLEAQLIEKEQCSNALFSRAKTISTIKYSNSRIGSSHSLNGVLNRPNAAFDTMDLESAVKKHVFAMSRNLQNSSQSRLNELSSAERRYLERTFSIFANPQTKMVAAVDLLRVLLELGLAGETWRERVLVCKLCCVVIAAMVDEGFDRERRHEAVSGAPTTPHTQSKSRTTSTTLSPTSTKPLKWDCHEVNSRSTQVPQEDGAGKEPAASWGRPKRQNGGSKELGKPSMSATRRPFQSPPLNTVSTLWISDDQSTFEQSASQQSIGERSSLEQVFKSLRRCEFFGATTEEEDESMLAATQLQLQLTFFETCIDIVPAVRQLLVSSRRARHLVVCLDHSSDKIHLSPNEFFAVVDCLRLEHMFAEEAALDLYGVNVRDMERDALDFDTVHKLLGYAEEHTFRNKRLKERVIQQQLALDECVFWAHRPDLETICNHFAGVNLHPNYLLSSREAQFLLKKLGFCPYHQGPTSVIVSKFLEAVRARRETDGIDFCDLLLLVEELRAASNTKLHLLLQGLYKKESTRHDLGHLISSIPEVGQMLNSGDYSILVTKVIQEYVPHLSPDTSFSHFKKLVLKVIEALRSRLFEEAIGLAKALGITDEVFGDWQEIFDRIDKNCTGLVQIRQVTDLSIRGDNKMWGLLDQVGVMENGDLTFLRFLHLMQVASKRAGPTDKDFCPVDVRKKSCRFFESPCITPVTTISGT